jgi:hypothetical protein
MTADSTGAVHVPATGTYLIDPEQSVVSCSGRHMFGLGTVHATFTVRSGTLGVEGDGIRLHAHADHLDRCAFGITGSRGMVGRYLDLDLDVFASRT